MNDEAHEAQNWRLIRDLVHELDAIHRPGAKMADDDVLDVVASTLLRAAHQATAEPRETRKARYARAVALLAKWAADSASPEPPPLERLKL